MVGQVRMFEETGEDIAVVLASASKGNGMGKAFQLGLIFTQVIRIKELGKALLHSFL